MQKEKDISILELWQNYKSELLFLFVLGALVVLGHRLSWYIPVAFMENVLTPLQHGANTAVCWVGAWLLFRHSDGLRVRKAYGYALIAWGISEVVFILQNFVWNMPVFHYGTEVLTPFMLLAGNFLGWLLMVYPTEALRPGWLNPRRAMWQLLPMVTLVVLDYLLPVDLSLLVSMYPLVLFALVVTHLRAYRIWCEDNYSSMDNIDVQWIVRYLFMLLVVGLSYLYIMLSDSPNRGVTQNALLFFVFAYSTEQILFRKDPWAGVKEEADKPREEEPAGPVESAVNNAQRIALEQWMAEERPYLNPEFQLMDLRRVLPMNRTYLSRFLHDEYDCSFYQFANGYRIEEAKRLMREQPDLKMTEVARLSGFASAVSFSRVFSQNVGISPTEWAQSLNNK